MSRCSSCGRTNRADARYCDHCGAPMPATSDPVRKVVTVVFGDLVGSTALQERLDPELAAGLMARYYEAMRAAVEQFGGRLEKLVGDGVVAVFGAPVAREDDAVRAVRCASGMLKRAAALSDDLRDVVGVGLRMRAGVHTGEVVFSADAELVGDTLNTAARVEQAAAPNEVLVAESTWRLVRHHVTAKAAPTPRLRGKAAPVRVWRLVSPEPDVARECAGQLESSLIGRDDALSTLTAALSAVEAGHGGRLVTIIGSPGVGKTRLVRDFAASVKTRATVVSVRCAGDGESVGCRTLTEELQRGLRRAQEIAADEQRRSPVRPVLVVLDELHAAPRSILAQVSRFAAENEALPIMLLVAARPQLRDLSRWLTQSVHPNHNVIDLPPLSPADALRLLGQLLGTERGPCALVDRIAESSEGNPLFLTESVRMLIDEAYLVREDGAWLCAQDPARVPVPPTIHQLVGARLERLQPQERALLERAAVVGRQFELKALEHLAGPQLRGSIQEFLSSLMRRSIIEPVAGTNDNAYRFCAELTRDVAYGRLLMQTRVELHESYAAWLRDLRPTSVDGQADPADWHTAQAQEYRRLLGCP